METKISLTFDTLAPYLHGFQAIVFIFILNDMSSGLFQVFLVKLRSLHGTSNHVHGGRLLLFRKPKPGTNVKYSGIVTRLQSGLNL